MCDFLCVSDFVALITCLYSCNGGFHSTHLLLGNLHHLIYSSFNHLLGLMIALFILIMWKINDETTTERQTHP